MSGISLTASIRSNLLSLQNIASQQDIVQNRLATGLKVSSAIDNPSSYYTASSLNNRAADLTALLDAMSQGIQTIKAASEAIDSGTKFLEQAKAAANQALALSTADIAARVSNEAELLAAVASGKEGLIVLEADIVMSENQTIKLQDGQSLVGAAYFNPGKQTSLTFNISGSNQDGIQAAENSLLSDFTINYHTDTQNLSSGAIVVKDVKNVVVQNLDIFIDSSYNTKTTSPVSGIRCIRGEVTLRGINNIDSKANYRAYAVVADGDQTIVNIEGIFNLRTRGDFSFGIMSAGNAQVNLKQGMTLNADSASYSLIVMRQGNIRGERDITINANHCFFAEGGSGPTYGGNSFYFAGGTHINMTNAYFAYLNKSENINPNPGYNGNALIMEAGVQITWQNENDSGTWINSAPTALDVTSTTRFTPADLTGMTKISANGPVLPNIDDEMAKKKLPVDGYKEDYSQQEQQYNQLLLQYDMLISDASYKGINLLEGQHLKINFNEDRSSKIDVPGVKADSESLGLKTKEWKTAEDVEKSISELEEAIGSLRSFASEFGNYYSIVTTRQDFTENLINVLEEGADKLTLADMNQESANMLALQTAQQLAVNSLSLASQASQSILRLF